MKHAIIGGGNLGLDIKEFGDTNNLGQFKIFSNSTGYVYPNGGLLLGLDHYQPDHIWVTIGAGSVEGAKKDIKKYISLHLTLPMELIQHFDDKVHIHLFSSDYVSHPYQSLYAMSKHSMELFVLTARRDNTHVYRVSNLYGTHKPETTFPGKLLRYNPDPRKITLPTNLMMPTPTAWLAKVLLHSCNSIDSESRIYDLVPGEGKSVHKWAAKIFDDRRYYTVAGGLDPERPKAPIGTGLPLPGIARETCQDLWDEYFKREDYE